MIMLRPFAMVMEVLISRWVISGESMLLEVLVTAAERVWVTSREIRSVLVICGVTVRITPTSS